MTPYKARNFAEQLADLGLDGAADAIRDLAQQVEDMKTELSAWKVVLPRHHYRKQDECVVLK